MRYVILIVMAFLLFVNGVKADKVVLTTGRSIEGTISVENDEVVIIRDADGRRYQFPRSDVQTVVHGDEAAATPEQQQEEKVRKDDGIGKVALRLDAGVAALCVPSERWGEAFGIDLQIGSRNMMDKRVFLGGSVGYMGALTNKMYSFIPLQLVMSAPLMEGKHSPEIGFGLGYGFAVRQPAGGLAARIDFSYRYQYSKKSALLVGVQTRFQQARIDVIETVDGHEYENRVGRSFVTIGMRLGIQF